MRIAKGVKAAHGIQARGVCQKDLFAFDSEKRTVISKLTLKEVCYEITVNFIIAQNNRAAPKAYR